MLKKIIMVLAVVFAFQYFYAGSATVKESGVKHDNVVLYATSWCGYCKKTRAFLAENDIQYTEYDVENSEEGRQQFEALGGNGVPVLDIRGTVVHGFSIKKFTEALKQNKLM